MENADQGRGGHTSSSEKEISVDLSEPDASKAVERRAGRSDIAQAARDTDGEEDRPRTRREKEMHKRMTRFSKSFDQRLADQEARHQREIADVRKQATGVSVERADSGNVDAAHEAAIKDLTTKLAAAIERGDSDEQAKITAQMNRLEGQYWAKKAQAAGVATRDEGATGAAATPGSERRPKAVTGPTPAGSRFILANEAWWEDPDFAVEKDAASGIYIRLVQEEGFEANDDETFKEVAKQLKKKFPKLEVKGVGARSSRRDEPDDEDDDRDGSEEGERRRERRPAPAANLSDRGAEGPQARRNRRVLTESEKSTMRQVGLDPNKNSDVLAFVREAQALEP